MKGMGSESASGGAMEKGLMSSSFDTGAGPVSTLH